jgi:ABC-type polysaccharide/polyol phosphate transport system, ATPase component
MHIIRSPRNVKIALFLLLVAVFIVFSIRLTDTTTTITVEPLRRPGYIQTNRPIWLMDIATASSPKTDWNNVELGEGWTKGADPSLPSGAAALASDMAPGVLRYTSLDRSLELVFAAGPEFASVRITVGNAITDLDLRQAEMGTVKQRIERPLLYVVQTASANDWLKTIAWSALLWLLLCVAYVFVARPHKIPLFRRLLPAQLSTEQVVHRGEPSLSDQPLDDDILVSVRNAGKMYRIYDQPIDRLKQMLSRGKKNYGREFWAVRNVSIEVRRGETVGIIGRNGSGKSTLLQMIAGTLTPSEGDILVRGRVAALLELGSGFNPEFTGRENVYLNGAVLGISREEMERRFDDIVAFADIGDFIDQPVKTYSSGMMVRLAFAVQASIEPDILIVDEALAVGDVFFQQKCYRHLEVLRERGTAVILVSHGMGDIKQFCQRTLFLNQGAPVFYGNSADAVAQYLLLEQQDLLQVTTNHDSNDSFEFKEEYTLPDVYWPPQEAFVDVSSLPQTSNGMVRCVAVAVCDAQGQPCQLFKQGDRVSFFYEFEVLQDIGTPLCGIELHNDKGITVHGKNSLQYDDPGPVPSTLPAGARLRCRQDVELRIAVGEYTFEVGLAVISPEDYLLRGSYATLNLYARIMRVCHVHNVGRLIVTERDPSVAARLIHWGLADLPGDCWVWSNVSQPADLNEQTEEYKVGL